MWRRLTLLALLAVGSSHRISARVEHPRTRPVGARAHALRPLLLLRGGGDDALPEPAEVETVGVEAEAPLDLKASVGCWSAFCKLLGAVKALLSPTYEYAKKDTDILGDTSQQSGFAADDESWRTQRKKIHEIELGPNARKRVLRDLRRLKQVREPPSGGCHPCGEFDVIGREASSPPRTLVPRQAYAQDEEIGLEVDDCEVLTDWVVKVRRAARRSGAMAGLGASAPA